MQSNVQSAMTLQINWPSNGSSFIFEKLFRDVILIQNVENLAVFVCKNTAFYVQLFLNDEALRSVWGIILQGVSNGCYSRCAMG